MEEIREELRVETTGRSIEVKNLQDNTFEILEQIQMFLKDEIKKEIFE